MPDAVEALKNCDMLIDCIFLLFSPAQFAIQAAGTGILTAVEQREKVTIAAGMLDRAKVMRTTSKHGTDAPTTSTSIRPSPNMPAPTIRGR